MKCEFFLDREGCIGCGACAAIDPENWKMNEDGKADLKNGTLECGNQKKEFDSKDLDKNLETAQSCPVNVIHIKKDDEEII